MFFYNFIIYKSNIIKNIKIFNKNLKKVLKFVGERGIITEYLSGLAKVHSSLL